MNKQLKKLSHGIATFYVIPSWLIYKIKSIFFGKTGAFTGISQRSSRWTGNWGVILRNKLNRKILLYSGEDIQVCFGTVLTKPSIELGDSVYIGSYCMIGDVTIGKDTLIADHVMIPSGNSQHGISRLDIPISKQSGNLKKIHIGEDCWIGSGSIILADIGNHSVIGAGSVVTKPIGDYLIVAGNPAVVIGDRQLLGKEDK
ncbi:MAG: acyltransferase [Chloroflexi bacterium]|nr:acyltransferase [Chloroflexota bacterium]